MIKVGITGGIGSGKSTVCRMFAELGAPVYDCDSRAKGLMQTSPQLREDIVALFGENCYKGTILDSAYLACTVFGNAERLRALEAVVHPCVRKDIEVWAEIQNADYAVIESAILFESGLNEMMDFTVAVLAPRSLRLDRAMKRDRANESKIIERMDKQASDQTLLSQCDISIVNISLEDVRKDVVELDHRFRIEGRK